MGQTENQNKERKKWKLSLKPVFQYHISCCLLLIAAIIGSAVFITFNDMKTSSASSLAGMKSQIEYRINQSISLLQSLALQERFYSTSAPAIEKVKELDKLNEHLGYLMMCYVDDELMVQSQDGPADLSSREYLQELFKTGECQVTDSFAAGSDGVTLNYTVAYPLMEDGKVSGCLFSAIYFDEIVGILKDYTKKEGVEGLLLGSEGQVMSSTDDKGYGKAYMQELKSHNLLNMNVADVETDLINRKENSFWSLKGGNIYLTSYAAIEGTNWNIISTISFFGILLTVLPNMLPLILGCILLFGLMMYLTAHNLKGQLQVVDMLVDSVEKLEEKLYQDERPDNVDFNEVLHLTSTGLSDGLTGVVTRTVFMNQLPPYLAKWHSGKIIVLCFVDLDDLKQLNDTYGHEIGDISLKSIGYVLREYEKKYDGLVGRYGGDEFILVMSDFDSEEEVREVMDELVLRLQTTVGEGGQKIGIKCSVGVSLWDGKTTVEMLIKEADESLYFVKQNGKGYYKIYQDDRV